MDDGRRVVAPTLAVKARLQWNWNERRRRVHSSVIIVVLRSAHVAVRRHGCCESSSFNVQCKFFFIHRDPARNLNPVGRCVALGRTVEERPGRIGHRVQSVQRYQTDQVIRPRAVLLQFRVVETLTSLGWLVYYYSH